MPGLVPGIHVFAPKNQDVDGRDKPGHDVCKLDGGTQCASTASSNSATMLVILIIGFTAGPAVSL
jgi:hypothetical protein